MTESIFVSSHQTKYDIIVASLSSFILLVGIILCFICSHQFNSLQVKTNPNILRTLNRNEAKDKSKKALMRRKFIELFQRPGQERSIDETLVKETSLERPNSPQDSRESKSSDSRKLYNRKVRGNIDCMSQALDLTHESSILAMGINNAVTQGKHLEYCFTPDPDVDFYRAADIQVNKASLLSYLPTIDEAVGVEAAYEPYEEDDNSDGYSTRRQRNITVFAGLESENVFGYEDDLMSIENISAHEYKVFSSDDEALSDSDDNEDDFEFNIQIRRPKRWFFQMGSKESRVADQSTDDKTPI